MIVSYSIRLICLCFASFYLVHLAIGLFALYLTPRIVRASASMHPQQAARLLLGLRVAPALCSIAVVAVLCVPSYLRYEQNSSAEEIGIFCVAAAAFGFILCAVSIGKGVHAVVQSFLVSHQVRFSPRLDSLAPTQRVIPLSGDSLSGMPLFALVGILRPKLIVSQKVLAVLSPEQLEAAFAHERAHQLSRDNFKRLIVLLTPDIFPFGRSFKKIESHWERCIELAADDRATLGQVDRSVALAEALIKVARLSNMETIPPLASSLSAGNQELAVRVNRLLEFDSTPRQPDGLRTVSWGSLFVLLGLSIVLLQRANMLYTVHRLSESLLR
jgi:Zn-dependent protease with chaperone function